MPLRRRQGKTRAGSSVGRGSGGESPALAAGETGGLTRARPERPGPEGPAGAQSRAAGGQLRARCLRSRPRPEVASTRGWIPGGSLWGDGSRGVVRGEGPAGQGRGGRAGPGAHLSRAWAQLLCWGSVQPPRTRFADRWSLPPGKPGAEGHDSSRSGRAQGPGGAERPPWREPPTCADAQACFSGAGAPGARGFPVQQGYGGFPGRGKTARTHTPQSCCVLLSTSERPCHCPTGPRPVSTAGRRQALRVPRRDPQGAPPPAPARGQQRPGCGPAGGAAL